MSAFAIVFPPLIHELGHFLAALAFGWRLRFRRRGWRWIWDMPDMARWKQKVIAIAGFGVELTAAPFFYAYGLAAVTHFCLYAFYADGKYNDFKWLVGEEWDR